MAESEKWAKGKRHSINSGKSQYFLFATIFQDVKPGEEKE